jgi:hypothetical protein
LEFEVKDMIIVGGVQKSGSKIEDNIMNIYEYQKPVGKIDDISELRDEFIAAFDAKTKNDTARFGLLYGRHILEITGFEECDEIKQAFEAVQKWIDGKVNYHAARNISFAHLYKNARGETDEIKKKFYKTIAQISCIPHVKAHGLWATDFAVTLINKIYPNNLDEVRKERQIQIDIIKNI